MAQRIHLRVPRYDLKLESELLPDLAPQSAAALTGALPAAGLVTCENHYGSVVCLRLPNFPCPLPPENATVFPIPGDVFLYQRAHGVELVVFYARMGGTPAGAPFDACGRKPGNRVGVVASPLTAALQEAARRVWTEGAAWGAAGAGDSAAVASVRDDRAAAAAEIEARRAAWHRRTWRDHTGRPASGGRRIALIVPEYDARTEVELAVAQAPHTCGQIWDHVPVETTLMHGRYSGPEMFTQIGGREWHWQPRPEHRIAYPIPGDVVLYFDPPPRIQLNYFYDRDAMPYGVPRIEVGNLVGWSAGDFGAFAEACWRIGYEGWKTLVVQRAE